MRNLNLLGTSALRSVAFLGAAVAIAAPAYAQTTAANAAQPAACDTNSPGYNPETRTCTTPQPGTGTGPVEEQNASGQPTRNADGSVARQETITVTGTRIKMPNLQSLEPTTTVDRRQIDERNFANAADALNELPGFRGSVTPAGAQGSFGQGVNFVNNYGLGSNRTLALVNGRRYVSSNVATLFNQGSAGTQVDLNVVPTILIDRIDTLSVGGAPVYGSDAISGTVNIIERTQFKGLEVRAISGITEQGDNFRYTFEVLAGANFLGDRLNLTFAASHDHVGGVSYNERDFLAANTGSVTNPSLAQATGLGRGNIGPDADLRLNPGIGFNNTTTDLFPGTILARNVAIPYLTRGGLITATNIACPASGTVTNPNNPSSCFGASTNFALQFDTQGNLVPFNQGILFPGTSGTGSQGFKFNDFSQITSDLNRTILNGFLTFHVTPQIDFFVEANHYRSRADELVQQPTFNSSLFGGSSGPLTFGVDSPFLTAQARSALQSRGVTVFQVSRASADLADLTGYNKSYITRFVAGLRGDFTFLGKGWNFETYLDGGNAVSYDYGQDVNRQNFINAVNVTTNASGQIVCTATPTRQAAPGGTPIADPNCVPLNLLGEGLSSQAARDYVIQQTTTRSEQRQRIFNANVGGTLFNLWSDAAVGLNVGYEHRYESASFTPDQFQQQGLGRSSPITPLKGSYKLDQFFGEVTIPLVTPAMGIPILNQVQAYGRGRYIQSSVNGGFFSYTVGGIVAPVRDIKFRANFTRSFRSPAITELFLPVVPAFNTVPDICSAATRAGGAAPAVRQANCAAFLAKYPNATPDTAATATVPVLSGGDPNLRNEQANSWTAGVLFQPRFLPRFVATVDYVNIHLKDPIANLTIAQVASACFDNPSFNTADPANGNAFCSLIKRDPTTGRVINDPANPAVKTGFVNGQEIQFRGIQGVFDYSVPLRALGLSGSFGIGGDWLYVLKRLNNITGVAPSRTDGILGDPSLSGQVRIRYAENSWGVSSTINWVGKQLFNTLNRAPGVAGSGADARELDAIDPYAITNVGLWFNAGKMRFTLSVTNLFNHQGQKYQGVLIPASYVDLLGRRYSASVRLNF